MATIKLQVTVATSRQVNSELTLPIWSHRILTSANGLLGPEHAGIAVEISLPFCPEAEIFAFEVYWSSSWTFPLPVCLAAGNFLKSCQLSCVEAEIHAS
jgi:hypothetical protein